MIDIHSHILPTIDDGPTDMGMALEMAKIAQSEGINKIIATPHVIPGAFDLTKEEILKAVEVMNRELKMQQIALEMLPGCEAYLDLDLPERISKGQLPTMNNGGKYLLVELPMQSFPNYTEEVFFKLKLQGITPILAHPERNLEIIRQPNLLYKLVSSGVLAQVNANSIIGSFGSAVAKTARLFLEHNLVHFVATDCHSTGVRGPRLNEAIKVIASVAGDEKSRELTLVNPQKIINGEKVEAEGYSEIVSSKPGFWGKIKTKLFS